MNLGFLDKFKKQKKKKANADEEAKSRAHFAKDPPPNKDFIVGSDQSIAIRRQDGFKVDDDEALNPDRYKSVH